MSFFFQTVAGILRGSVNDSRSGDRDYCCRHHLCHHHSNGGGIGGIGAIHGGGDHDDANRIIERSPVRRPATLNALTTETAAPAATATATATGDIVDGIGTNTYYGSDVIASAAADGPDRTE